MVRHCSARDRSQGERATDTNDRKMKVETSFAREEWSKLFQSLKKKIGPLDSYWEIFDSTENGEPVQGSLAGDISEVYYDLKNDLRLEQKTISRADLLWELRESFTGHWGRHALEALKAIRDLHL
jgi:hypothetical protein